MPVFKKHIAILLFGIFFFPIAYQPYHVLKHDPSQAHCSQNCCHSYTDNKDCNDGVHFSTKSKEIEHCPICDYHFPIKIIPKLNLFKPAASFTKCHLYELRERLPFEQTISKKSPRAPPALLFS